MNIYFETYGCSLNHSDSEAMKGILIKSNFKIVNNINNADVIIINSCIVKEPTEDKILSRIKELKSQKKTLIVTGCMAQTNYNKLNNISILGTHQIDKIREVVEETINNNIIHAVTVENNERLNLPTLRTNKYIAIIPISKGCLGYPCAYCKVKQARGTLVSYSPEKIINKIKTEVIKGAKEIWITSQDNGCYGYDINTNIVELLKEVCKINGNFKIRLGMANPNHIIKHLTELIEIFKDKKMYKFLHIPVQSGNNEILKSMRRKYTIEEYTQIIKKFKEEIPEITIATDIIVGFPGETHSQFIDTLLLIRKTKPAICNISRFWPRSGTEAAQMKNKVNHIEIKKRIIMLTDVFKNIAKMENERWLDWKGRILITEKGKNNTMIGRNYAYKSTITKKDCDIGENINVKITKVSSYDLFDE